MTDETRKLIELAEKMADSMDVLPSMFGKPSADAEILRGLVKALEAALKRERLGAEAMRKLANEASGFLAMAEKDNFGGVTNRRCLAHRIMLARERLKAREPVETRPDHTDLSREKGGSV